MILNRSGEKNRGLEKHLLRYIYNSCSLSESCIFSKVLWKSALGMSNLLLSNWNLGYCLARGERRQWAGCIPLSNLWFPRIQHHCTAVHSLWTTKGFLLRTNSVIIWSMWVAPPLLSLLPSASGLKHWAFVIGWGCGMELDRWLCFL